MTINEIRLLLEKPRRLDAAALEARRDTRRAYAANLYANRAATERSIIRGVLRAARWNEDIAAKSSASREFAVSAQQVRDEHADDETRWIHEAVVCGLIDEEMGA